MRRFLIAVALGLSLVLAGSAAAATDPSPVRFWSVSKVVQGTGEAPVTDGAQVGGTLRKTVGLGRVVFNLPLHAPYWYFLPRDEAFGSLFSSADGARYSVMAQAPPPNPVRVGAVKGGVTHLDEYQAYEKRAGDASLRITISDALLQTVDTNSRLAAWECPADGNCEPVRAVVRFHARAYAASAGGDFFDAGVVAYLEGHEHSWRPGAATAADSQVSLWKEDRFDVDGDADDSDTGSLGEMVLNKSRSLKVPLGSVHTGELFAVHVSLEAEAVDDRGGESGAQAFIQDPQHREPLLTAHGLKRRGKPRFKEPAVRPVQPAHCSGRVRGAGVLAFSDARFAANESERAPMVLVTRSGGSRGSASATVTARAGTARAGRDFRATTTTVRFGPGDAGPRLVEIPLREDAQAEPAETFNVALGHARCGALGARHRATVSIVDDDQGPPPRPPSPSGARSTACAAAGSSSPTGAQSCRSPPTGASPSPARARRASPTTSRSGPSRMAPVRCAPWSTASGRSPAPTSPTSPSTARRRPSRPAWTPRSAATAASRRLSAAWATARRWSSSRAARIVTAGWRTTAAGVDFALTRHDATGRLDPGFGTGGIVTTDLGGDDDEAYDAALLPDGGIVAVGRTDAAGFTALDFGVVRYRSDGAPDTAFGSSGIVKTDLLGGGDQANAVAVQPDGKIVVAGFAVRNGIDGDFALVRYNADGTRDQGFGSGGIVTTDLGTRSDDARALVIQPDGRIVVAGSAGEDIGLARYTSTGTLDATFGQGGTAVTDFGSEDVANGVALTSGGHIAIAGYTLGPHVDRDFLLARYTAAGTLDTAFGDHGTVKTDLGGGDDFAENLLVDTQGRIVVVGRAGSATILDMALARYNADGTLDAGFDGDGIITADFHGRGEFGQDVALDAAGRIVAAGYTANGADTGFALLRTTP